VFNTFRLCFDKPVLSIPAVSFDALRTNGWDVEGLTTNGMYRYF
jgi:hypothetical protein